MDLTKLSEAFASDDIEWRIGRAGKNTKGIWATCFAYVTNRAIMDRLDSVCGVDKWKNEYVEFTVGAVKGTLCGISIHTTDGWVTKWDGSDPSDMESFKGGLSDSMKRAAVQWGIGRYLYNIEEGFATIVQKGNGAKYSKLPKDKGGDEFYWNPPVLGKEFTPQRNVTTKKPAISNAPSTPEQIQEIKDLCENTETDYARLCEHYKVVNDGWNGISAEAALKVLKDRLNSQLNQVS